MRSQQQQLAPVLEQLRDCGYAGTLQEALHAGRARKHALEALISRLLSGRSAAEVLQQLESRGAGEQTLSADERWAAGCQQLLSLLGVRASADDIRGCGEGGGGTLLLQLAELVTSVERSCGKGRSAACTSGAAARARGDGASGACATSGASAGGGRLLDAACSNSGALFSDTLQLFPRDLAAVAEEYRDTADRLPLMLGRMRMQLQVQEAQTGPAAATLVAGSTAGTIGHAELGDQLQRLHGAVQQLTQVFKQELGVWTSSGAGACAVVDGADDGVARAVATAVTGHRAVGKLVDAMGLLMDMHITLQDVPGDWLAGLAAAHSAAAAELGRNLQALEAAP